MPVEPKPLRSKAEIVADVERRMEGKIFGGEKPKLIAYRKSEFDQLVDSLLAKSDQALSDLSAVDNQRFYERD